MQSTWIRRVPGFRSAQRWKQIVAGAAYGTGALTLIGLAGGGSQPAPGHTTAQVAPTPSSAVATSPTPTTVIVTPAPTVIATPVPTMIPTPVPTPVPVRVPTPVSVAPATGLGANAAANPSGSDAPAVAAGASAVCADGTYSVSAHRSGTCSHHGGVHWWTGNLGPAGPGAR
jgi:Protein of unknown function (DUF3761)